MPTGILEVLRFISILTPINQFMRRLDGDAKRLPSPASVTPTPDLGSVFRPQNGAFSQPQNGCYTAPTLNLGVVFRPPNRGSSSRPSWGAAAGC